MISRSNKNIAQYYLVLKQIVVEYIPWTVTPQRTILRKMDDNLSAQKLLGERVRKQRNLLQLSQEELAFRAEVDRTYVSQIERGIGNPSLQVLLRLAKVLQTPFAQLVEGM